MTSTKALDFSPLGKKSAYINQYDPTLLFSIPRKIKRDEIQVPALLPFEGYDLWNAYELSWLNPKGKPQVALAEFRFDCRSENIIESKSFKLYLNSFNNTSLDSVEHLETILFGDLQTAAQGVVTIKLFTIDAMQQKSIDAPSGICLDDLDIAFEDFRLSPECLRVESAQEVHETLYSNLLKSNCLVTGQPDWGTIEIEYTGLAINRESLLRYIVSFRDHNEFHEQCVERIFMDLQKYCSPQDLTVKAYYTRRGGLDINPVRSTRDINIPGIRLARQ